MKIIIKRTFETSAFPMVEVESSIGNFVARWAEELGETRFPMKIDQCYRVELSFSVDLEWEVNARKLYGDDARVEAFSKMDETILRGTWDGYDVATDEDVEVPDIGYFRVGEDLLMMIDCKDKSIVKGTPMELRANSMYFIIYPFDPA